MKVTIFFSEPIHYSLAAGSRVINYAQGLQSAGCDVKIIMPFGFIARKNIQFQQSGAYNGVKYEYSSFIGFHPRKKYPFLIAGLLLIAKRLLGNIFVLFKIRSEKPDVLFVYSGSNIQVFFLVFLNYKPLRVSELCEIPYYYKSGISKLFSRWFRLKIIGHFFDAYITISINLQTYIKKASPNISTLKVPILIGNDLNNGTISKKKEFYIVHTGSMSERKDGIVSLLKSVGLIHKQYKLPIKIYVTGFKEAAFDLPAIDKVIEEYDIKDNVIFTGYLNDDQLVLLQRGASLAIIYKNNNEQNQYNFPTKLAEYLYWGIPVIVTPVGEMLNYLIDGVNAYITKDISTEAVAQKILLAFNDPELKEKIITNGRNLVSANFDNKIHGIRLKAFWNELLN